MNTAHSKSNPMIMVSLIVALLLLIVAIVYSSSKPATGPKVIHLSSGEWAPYSGEALPQKGIASVIVKSVLEQMGYRVDLQFMPWSIAKSKAESSQQDNQIRGTFPYIRTPQRESQFYFSDPIIEVPNGIFFHLQNTPLAANISNPADLQDYAVITLAGYEYTANLGEYIPQRTCNFKDTLQGFEILQNNHRWILLSTKKLDVQTINMVKNRTESKRLKLSETLLRLSEVAVATLPDASQINNNEIFAYQINELTANSKHLEVSAPEQNIHYIVTPAMASKTQLSNQTNMTCQLPLPDALLWLAYMSKPKVLIESQQVGESLLTKSMPELAAKVGFAQYIDYVPHSVMFTKNNPNNLSLRNQFNDVLNNLKSNPQAYQSLLTQASNEIDLADSVNLIATGGQLLVEGQLYDPQLMQCSQSDIFTFPKGSKALVRQWPELFLRSTTTVLEQKVVASVLNGPLASKTTLYCFQPTAVQLQ